MRLLLVLTLTFGMAPGLGEVAETVVHLAASGHLAHSHEDPGDLGEQGDEHGCGATQHNCGCCASQTVAAAPRAEVIGAMVAPGAQAPAPAFLASIFDPAPPFRPPIAS